MGRPAFIMPNQSANTGTLVVLSLARAFKVALPAGV